MRTLRQHLRKVLTSLVSTGLLLGGACIAEAILPKPAEGAEEIRIRTVGPFVFTLSIDSLATFAETGEITGDLKNYARFLDQQTLTLLQGGLSYKLPLDVNTVAHLSYSPLGRDAIENVGKVIRVHPEVNGFHGLRAALIGAAANAGPDGWTAIDAMRQFPTDSIEVSLKGLLALRRELSVYLSYNQAAVAAILDQAATEAAQQTIVPESLADLAQPGPFNYSRSTITVHNPSLRQTAEGISVNYDFDVDVFVPQNLAAPAPVVIMSHGFGAVKEDFIFMAEHLASHGYVVLLPNHVGSNLSYRQEYLSGRLNTLLSPAEFINRPQEISFLIDELERLVAVSPDWAAVLDLDRIGVAGDSLGGSTVLALSGAEINFPRLIDSCDRENLVLNFALYLECRARFLPPKNYNLSDGRIQAVIAAHPLGAAMFGPEGISQIDIPFLMVSGNADIVSPVVPEQIHPFVWLNAESKYMALLRTGTHFSSKPAGEGAEGIWLLLAGDHRDVGANYYKMLTLAFWQVYLRDQENYRPYLTASYADFISEGQPMNLDIIQSLSPEQLAAANGGSTPIPVIPPPLVAAPEPRTESILASIQDTGQLRIGLRRDAPPFGYVSAAGEWTGYCVDLAEDLGRHLTEELGLTLDVELIELPSTLENRFDLVREGDVDLECGPNTIRPDVEGIGFSNLFFASGTRFLTPARNQASVNPNRSLEGILVGVLSQTTNEAFVRDTYPRADIVTFSGPSSRRDAIQALNNGDIQTFASDGILSYGELIVQDLPTSEFVFQPELPLTCEFYGLIMPNNDPEWMAFINDYLNSEEEEAIWEGWFAKALPGTLNTLEYCLNR